MPRYSQPQFPWISHLPTRVLLTGPRRFAPLAALFLLAACDSPVVSINGHSGVPLDQLDLGGKAPTEVTLLGPDTVHVRHGDRLAITVSGDHAVGEHLRFVLADGKLGIGRETGIAPHAGLATVTVILPAASQLVMAGSGNIDADRLDGAKVGATIAGSGSITAGFVNGGEVTMAVLGSGSIRASGRAHQLHLNLSGSGSADLTGLVADAAELDVLGSGGGAFASDGPVHGEIAGSGEVRVRGKATCAVTVTGSGRVVCAP